MNSPPRRHHYVPAFHLARFTCEGRRDSRLFVFDQSRLKSWPSTPDGAAHQRDFYTIDVGPDVHPAAFEAKVLSEVDGQFNKVIARVLAEQQIPDDGDFNVLLNFVATAIARIPHTRQLVNQVFSHVAYEAVKRLIATDQGWNAFLTMTDDGERQMNDEDAARLRQLILDEQFDISLDNTSHVREMTELVGALLPALGERNWSIGFAAPSMHDFICSDVPVSLVPNERLTDLSKAGLLSRETNLMMPLSRRSVLVGSYDEWPPAHQVSEFGVLALNSYTIRESTQVFSATEEFSFLGGDRQPKQKNDLIKALRSGSYRHSNLEPALRQWLEKYEIDWGDGFKQFE